MGLLLLEHVLGFLGLHRGVVTLLVVLLEIGSSIFLFLDNLLGDAIEFPILIINLINNLLVLLNILDSSVLDLLEKSNILLLYLLLLGLMVLNELLHLSHLHLKLLEFLVVLSVNLVHFLLGLVSDFLGLLKGILCHDMVLVEIL